MRSLLVVGMPLVVASACVEDKTKAPPLITEPQAGVTFDRTRLRARITPPLGYEGAINTTMDCTQCGHAKWRIDGGSEHEADDFTSYPDEIGRFAFGITVPEGTHHVELARCDNIDTCAWSGVDVAVALHAGSPDPTFGGTGMALLDGVTGVNTVGVRSDGSMWFVSGGSLATRATVRHIKDGALTATFEVNAYGIPHVAGDAIAVSNTAGINFQILIDSGLGQNRDITPPAGYQLVAGPADLAVTPSGGFILGGTVSDGANKFAAVFELDSAGITLGSVVLADGTLDTPPLAIDVDGSGNIAVATSNQVLRGNMMVGIDSTFGANGRVEISDIQPGDLPTVALDGDGAAIAYRSDLYLIKKNGLLTKIALPLMASAGPPALTFVTAGASGDLYVAGRRPQLTEKSGSNEPMPGFDDALVHIRNGAIDTAFGDFGVAWANSRLAFHPITTESSAEAPAAVAVASDGGIYVVGTTESYYGSTPYRGPAASIVRFKP